MTPFRTLPAIVFVIIGLGTASAAAAPKVVASILPLHSLVAGVMRDVGEPYLLVQGGASPHDFAFSPSSARALQSAEAVFWIGPNMESFLVKPLASLTGEARVVPLSRHLSLLEGRNAGGWKAHEHENEDHDDKEHMEAGHGHEDHAHEDHAIDMHVWLDPENAKAMVPVIVATLQGIDAANASVYAANGKALIVRLERLDVALNTVLSAVKDKPYVVFHDAYQYFERRYGLNAIGSITVSPDRSPGARRLVEIREKIRVTGARCVFAEPQFPPALVATVTEGSGAKPGALDPLGVGIPPGPDAYFTLMENLAQSLRDCLS